MSTEKKVSILSISLILLALFGSVYLPEYKIWFNLLAMVSFGGTLFNQVYQLYKSGKEWKKYTLIYATLCIVLGVLLFI